VQISQPVHGHRTIKCAWKTVDHPQNKSRHWQKNATYLWILIDSKIYSKWRWSKHGQMAREGSVFMKPTDIKAFLWWLKRPSALGFTNWSRSWWLWRRPAGTCYCREQGLGRKKKVYQCSCKGSREILPNQFVDGMPSIKSLRTIYLVCRAYEEFCSHMLFGKSLSSTLHVPPIPSRF